MALINSRDFGAPGSIFARLDVRRAGWLLDNTTDPREFVLRIGGQDTREFGLDDSNGSWYLSEADVMLLASTLRDCVSSKRAIHWAPIDPSFEIRARWVGPRTIEMNWMIDSGVLTGSGPVLEGPTITLRVQPRALNAFAEDLLREWGEGERRSA